MCPHSESPVAVPRQRHHRLWPCFSKDSALGVLVQAVKGEDLGRVLNRIDILVQAGGAGEDVAVGTYLGNTR